jgi:hypothetical protein
MDPRLAAYMLMSKPEEYWKAQTAALAPTDATKMATQAGLDPRAANKGALDKANYIAPLDVKPGGTLFDVQAGKPIFNAPESNGNRFTYDALGNPTMSRTPGADATVSAAEAASLRGKNSQTIAPEGVQEVLPDGRKVIRTVGETIQGGSAPASGGKQGLDTSKMSPEEIEYLKKRDPEAFAEGVKRFAAGAKYGQEKGATDAQNALDKRWGDLQAQNSTAETNNSYLQNIKELAVKAAVGPQADKINLLNGLLSLVGNEKATGAVTDKNLIDKYSNQIIARLGQGSLGTDAARSIIEAANPNSKMTKEAISEAVDNLVGANKMIQAKTQLLSQHGNARDPVAYSQKEIAFDQAADPRIWQYASMKPEQRAAFKTKLAQQGGAQEFGQKIRTLESLGVKF